MTTKAQIIARPLQSEWNSRRAGKLFLSKTNPILTLKNDD
jgi:hypothetical protein